LPRKKVTVEEACEVIAPPRTHKVTTQFYDHTSHCTIAERALTGPLTSPARGPPP
jgi:hypothetical protein